MESDQMMRGHAGRMRVAGVPFPDPYLLGSL